VLRVIVAALGELQRAAPAHVGDDRIFEFSLVEKNGLGSVLEEIDDPTVTPNT
jgi:hypothetical protein